MRVPRELELCNPVVGALRSLGGSGCKLDIAEVVISQMQLPEDVGRQPHGTSGQTEIKYLLARALTVLKTCGLAANPQRGIRELTQAGARQQPFDAPEINHRYFRLLKSG